MKLIDRVWQKQILFTLTEHGFVRVLDALVTFDTDVRYQ